MVGAPNPGQEDNEGTNISDLLSACKILLVTLP